MRERRGGPASAPSGVSRRMIEEDYRVRVLDGSQGTGTQVRVLIESADDHGPWTTVGVSPNILEASWEALADSIEYGLARHEGAVRVPGKAPTATTRT